MKKLAIILLAVFAIAGCKNRNKATVEVVEAETVAPVDMHSAKTSLDYPGTYQGTIPCADCEGIEMSITIDKDGNFSRTMKYLRSGDDKEFKDGGKYQWDATGNVIEFLNQKDTDMYMVGENRLMILDSEGNVVTGALAELYVLTKQPSK